jgi:hypothetical protein
MSVRVRDHFLTLMSAAAPKSFWNKPLELKDPRGFTAEELQGMDGRYQDHLLWNADPLNQDRFNPHPT